MAFKVITAADGSSDNYGNEQDRYRFPDGSGVLQVDRADATRVYYSPFGGWFRVEETNVEPERGGNVW
jgi:hypothetical protein